MDFLINKLYLVSFIWMSSVLAEIFPFDCQNFNIFFFALSHNSVIYGLNFMKPLLNIYDHSEAMHI